MRVKVEAEWDGSRDGFSFRLTWRMRGRYFVEHVNGADWTRATATAALDLLGRFGVWRRNVRFEVR